MSGRRRWALRFLVLAVLAAALWYRHGGTDTREQGESNSGAVLTGESSSRSDELRAFSEAARRAASLPVIKPGALRLEGIVVDDEEHPVGGVHVVLGAGHEMTTEADGGFAFDGLAQGMYTVIADKGEWYAE